MTCSYFFLFTFLATLNTSTPKTKTSVKPAKKEESTQPEKKEGKEPAKDSKDTKSRPPSQIPKKTSPKKSLVPVKEESVSKDTSRRANSK